MACTVAACTVISPVKLPPVITALPVDRLVVTIDVAVTFPLTEPVTGPIRDPNKVVAETRSPDKLPTTLPVKFPTTLLLKVGLVMVLFKVIPALIYVNPGMLGLGINDWSELNVANTKLPY